jgi:hypothetical protein
MHRLYRLTLGIMILPALMLGCASVNVSQDYDVDTDFSRLKTYAWQSRAAEKSAEGPAHNPLLESRIRKAVDRNLAQKGFRTAESGSADFHVAHRYSVRRKIDSGGVRTGVGIGIGGSRTFGGVGVSGSPVREIDEGLLVIDATDADSGELMWRGTGTYEAKQEKDPRKTTQRINQVVDKIMAQFPPPAQD